MTKQAKITRKGQVTIPAEVRDALGLREGDTIAFEVDSQGQAKHRAIRVGSFSRGTPGRYVRTTTSTRSASPKTSVNVAGGTKLPAE